MKYFILAICIVNLAFTAYLVGYQGLPYKVNWFIGDALLFAATIFTWVMDGGRNA